MVMFRLNPIFVVAGIFFLVNLVIVYHNFFPSDCAPVREIGIASPGTVSVTQQQQQQQQLQVKEESTNEEQGNSRTLEVEESACSSPIRLGKADDGGWWACDLPQELKRDCLVYSFGIRDDISFDVAVENNWGCEVHGFDPSIDEAMRKSYASPKRVFHDQGLGMESKVFAPGTAPFRWPGMGYLTQKNTRPWKLERLSDTIEKLGHKSRRLTMLKMDVEGAEWFAIHELAEKGLFANLDQFAVELHFNPSQFKLKGNGKGAVIEQTMRVPNDKVKYLNLLSTLKKSGLVLWKLTWNGSCCLEASFIRRKK